MEIKEILACVDHTLLRQEATAAQIRELCDEGVRYGCASVCLPPAYVAEARGIAGGRVAICTVVGFPNGYQTTAAKCFETAEAVKCGADEIDMVIRLGWLKEKNYEALRREIAAVKSACDGRILKVIIETCLLTEEEKALMCGIVAEGGADYIKTSTGFSTSGATAADVALLAKYRPQGLKIKAAGGIATLADAENFLTLGADRLGTSRIVKIVKELKARGEYHG